MRAAVRLKISTTWDGEPVAGREQVWMTVAADEDALTWRVLAADHGDPRPPGPPGPRDRLWTHEVVELFVHGNDGRYLELELGPGGHWLALDFSAYRAPLGCPRLEPPTIRPIRLGAGLGWRARWSIPLAQLPPAPHQVAGFAIHGLGAQRRYLAAIPARGPAPDFHRVEHARPLSDRGRPVR